ncbi:MAG: hypothetical protein AAF657_14050 [Acidobacteriota bacterium]
MTDGTERLTLKASIEQTDRARAFCSTVRPVSSSHRQMLAALASQLDTLDECHRLLMLLNLGKNPAACRMLWLQHRQLLCLQTASAALTIERQDQFERITRETDEIPTLSSQAEAELVRRFGQPEAILD